MGNKLATRSFSIFLLLVLLISGRCTEPVFDIKNLNGNKIGIMGHRGMGRGAEYPGNSLESIAQVLSIGANGTEIDVQLTKDSVLVLYHDDDLANKTNYAGSLLDYNWAELDTCTYRSNSSKQFRVISVDELFSGIPDVHEYYFSFDIKFYPGPEPLATYYRQFVNALQKVITAHDMHDRVFVETGSTQLLKLLKASGIRVLLFASTSKSKFKDGMAIAKNLDLYGVCIGSRVSKKQIELAHANGLMVMTWTPKTPRDNIRAIKKNPDFIQTDQIVHMLQLFGRYKGLD